MRGRHVGNKAPDPLQPVQLIGDGRPVRFGHSRQCVRVGRQVVGDHGAAELELLLAQERRHPGPDRVGRRGLRVGGKARISGQLRAKRGQLGQRFIAVVHSGQVRRPGAEVRGS